MPLRLTRMIRRDEDDGNTAGIWLVAGQGLVLLRQQENGPAHWMINYNPWLDSRQVLLQPHLVQRLRHTRHSWLRRHGLDQAEFPTRRAAAQALEYALQRDPLPRLRGAELDPGLRPD